MGKFSNRWRTVDEVEAARLAALVREVKPRRSFEKRREPKPPKPAPKPKPRQPAHPFEVGEAPPDHFLLAHVFTLAGAISTGTMARKLVRPQ